MARPVLLLGLFLLSLFSAAHAQSFDDDEVFIVACCALGTYGEPSSDAGAVCTKAFCDKATANQAKAFKEFEQKIVKAENDATKDGFEESHNKGEMEVFGDNLLKSLQNKEIATNLPKYTGTTAKLTSTTNLAFLESQDSSLVRQARLLRRFKQGATTDSANIYGAANTLWPHGYIKYKWGGNLAGSLTAMSDPVKAVLFWYATAMKQWEKDTCIWFEESDTANLLFNDSTHGSACSALGTAARWVRVEQSAPSTSRTRECAEHELGHVIGFDHTNKRTDAFNNPATAGDHITFDMNACVNRFWAYCTSTPAETTGNSYVQSICTGNAHANLVNSVVKRFWGVDPYGYDSGNPAKRAECNNVICVYKWIYQYDKIPGYNDGGAYEYGSIMHYPFDVCIQKITTKNDAFGNKAPGKNRVTDNDRSILNGAYGCQDLTVNWANSKPAKTIKVHPQLPSDKLKAYIAKKLGWNGTWKVKKTGGAEVTGTGAIGATLTSVDIEPRIV